MSNVPESGVIITLTRELPIERTSDFQEGGALRANTLNHELDYQIACQQQIADNLNRSMVLPPYAADSGTKLTLPMPSAGKAIVWNSEGTNLENSTVSVNALESTLRGYKESAESAASTATTKADNAATSATTATTQAGIATAKAEEAASTLSSKVNKNMDDLSSTGKETVMALRNPDYTSGISISSGYTAPKDGVFLYQCALTSGSYSIKINGQNVWSCFSGGGLLFPTLMIPVGKGDVITFTLTADQPVHTFFPFKGGDNA